MMITMTTTKFICRDESDDDHIAKVMMLTMCIYKGGDDGDDYICMIMNMMLIVWI